MKYAVDFLNTLSDGSQEITATAFYDTAEDKITVDRENLFKSLLIEDEFIIGKNGMKVSVKNDDKLTFMKNLKYAFTGSMLRATEVYKINE